MSKITKDRMGILGLACAGTLVAAPFALADVTVGEQTGTTDEPIQVTTEAAEHVAAAEQKPAVVQGTFSFSQAVVTPNHEVANRLGGTSTALCDGDVTRDAMLRTNPLGWTIGVRGDVQEEAVIDVGEAASVQSVVRVMSCTCGGNPVDGKASINAEVKGIPVTYFLNQVTPTETVNTVTFVSSDGTTLSLPLAYVVGRHAQITYDINGESVADMVGGANQLWIPSAPAFTYVRDIVDIYVTNEEEIPEVPQASQDANLPNIAVGAAVTL